MIWLSESDTNLASHALAMAASKYVELAADCETMPGGDRLVQQFRLQAIQARKFAIMLDGASGVQVQGANCTANDAHEDARRITAQEIIDVRNERARRAA